MQLPSVEGSVALKQLFLSSTRKSALLFWYRMKVFSVLNHVEIMPVLVVDRESIEYSK